MVLPRKLRFGEMDQVGVARCLGRLEDVEEEARDLEPVGIGEGRRCLQMRPGHHQRPGIEVDAVGRRVKRRGIGELDQDLPQALGDPGIAAAHIDPARARDKLRVPVPRKRVDPSVAVRPPCCLTLGLLHLPVPVRSVDHFVRPGNGRIGPRQDLLQPGGCLLHAAWLSRADHEGVRAAAPGIPYRPERIAARPGVAPVREGQPSMVQVLDRPVIPKAAHEDGVTLRTHIPARVGAVISDPDLGAARLRQRSGDLPRHRLMGITGSGDHLDRIGIERDLQCPRLDLGNPVPAHRASLSSPLKFMG